MKTKRSKIKDKFFSRASILFFLFLLSALTNCISQGMWLPGELSGDIVQQMKNLGLKLDAKDIYSEEEVSMKDAVVLFANGCTTSIISNEGLLLTNHHCGSDQILNHTTLENNYLKNGFWAQNKSEELPNPGLTVSLIESFEDVTDLVMKDISSKNTLKEINTIIKENIENIKNSTLVEKYENVQVVSFYMGLKYYKIKSVVYKDIRLVGAPPSSIGNFGFDTDNWVWPRHAGDFSMFRIYVGKDNLPAEYSPENIPFKPDYFLPVSLNGFSEGDFTLVYGFPARTNEYMPSRGIEYYISVVYPPRVEIRQNSLEIMGGYMRESELVDILYSDRQYSLANGWKKWKGVLEGIAKVEAVKKRKQLDFLIDQKVKSDKKLVAKYGDILSKLDSIYDEISPYTYMHSHYDEIFQRNVDIIKRSKNIRKLLKDLKVNGDSVLLENREKLLKSWTDFYNNYLPVIDKEILTAQVDVMTKNLSDTYLPATFINQYQQLGQDSEQFVEKMFSKSVLVDSSKMLPLLRAGSAGSIGNVLKIDKVLIFEKDFTEFYNDKIRPELTVLSAQLNESLKNYMQVQLLVVPDKVKYPDANSTLRLTYGQVKAYSPKDAVNYHYQTTMDGIIEKYIPGDYEFDLSPKMLELYQNRDYGQYAEGEILPVCFIGTNHTTGGNSGSPVLDKNGYVIGLNFDRVWEGTMSDLYFDDKICRNIMVDIRYVLWVIDKYAGAEHLINEIKIIN